MNPITHLHNLIIHDLETAGRASPYTADANEPDPRYKSYGVRAKEIKSIFTAHRKAIRALTPDQQINLAYTLIHSEFGEQQSIALLILDKHVTHFSPDRFTELDSLVRCIHGWSKIDAFTSSLLREILFRHPAEFLKLVRSWNTDPDMWLRRASVVLFTRKVAKSGQFNDVALEMCHNLIHDPEDLVQKGVGWALKDLMRSDKERIKKYVLQLRQQGIPSTITLYAIRDLKGQERINFLDQSKNISKSA